MYRVKNDLQMPRDAKVVIEGTDSGHAVIRVDLDGKLPVHWTEPRIPTREKLISIIDLSRKQAQDRPAAVEAPAQVALAPGEELVTRRDLESLVRRFGELKPSESDAEGLAEVAAAFAKVRESEEALERVRRFEAMHQAEVSAAAETRLRESRAGDAEKAETAPAAPAATPTVGLL